MARQYISKRKQLYDTYKEGIQYVFLRQVYDIKKLSREWKKKKENNEKSKTQ